MRLVIAEKPAVARSIAAVLGSNDRIDGYLQGGGYLVSWCVGHLLELAPADAYDPRYAKWKHEDLPILPERWQYVVSKDKRKQLNVLRGLMARKDVDGIICATDAGREGELIFRLVYTYCGCQKPVQRLWISSLEESAIAGGFQNLKDGSAYNNLYQAALCRAQADWLVGINATRLFSVLYHRTLNVGRVMTPTLAMIVQREADIAAFKKEPFYTVELDCNSFTASSDKLGDKAAAEAIRTSCDGKTAMVTAEEQKEKAEKPPRLYDLTALQREANRLLGFTAQQTLDYVQALYEKKLVTYPRTDSRYLTEDMAENLPGLIVSASSLLPFAESLPLPMNTGQVIDNTKVSDHHAIIPTAQTAATDMASLPGGERSILTLIAVRLLCAVGDKHTYAETVVTLACEGNSFTAKGKTVLQPGWKAMEQAFKATLTEKHEKKEIAALPELAEGQVFDGIATKLREGFTSPPKHYTEDMLLSAMETAGIEDMPEDAERKGLGTPATRAGILEKLVKTGFVERKGDKKTKHLLPTKKGVGLIAVLPEIIKSPALTAEWEEKLKQVERGKLAPGEFMAGIAAMTRGLVRNYETDRSAAALFHSDREVVGVCPRCGASVVEGKKGFTCENPDCRFALWKDNRFFAAKKKELTRKIAAALLKDGRAALTGCYSEKTGKTYDAVAVLNDTGGKYVNFRLEFGTEGKRYG